jgi:hypothetical protein
VITTGSSDREPRPGYPEYLALVQAQFSFAVRSGEALYTTDARDLWAGYLGALPADERGHHTCHACRQFVERFGGLVTIDEHGNASPVLWHAPPHGVAPAPYGAAHRRLRRIVEAARVTGVHVTSERVWGTASTRVQPVGGRMITWEHLHVVPPANLVYTRTPLKTAGQRAAELRADRETLCRALGDFRTATVEQALSLVESEVLYRSEKVAGPLRWLLALQRARASTTSHRAAENLAWRAAATAPPGWCHVRSTVTGSLLEDLEVGLSLSEVKRRFDAKMSPLQYQRPQAPPTAGNLARAEQVVEALRSAGALDRRVARLEDLRELAVWQPRGTRATAGERAGSVFGHLLPAAATLHRGTLTRGAVTWENFRRTLLPHAAKIEYHVPVTGNFLGFVTATGASAPPILQWDTPERRMPVSWYVYQGGSMARDWSLRSGAWVAVDMIARLPPMRDVEDVGGHHGAGVVLVLDGLRDTRARSCGLGLFPEILKAEYREVRASIEAYSRAGRLADSLVCGYAAGGVDLRRGARWDARVRVTGHDGSTVECVLDRWD